MGVDFPIHIRLLLEIRDRLTAMSSDAARADEQWLVVHQRAAAEREEARQHAETMRNEHEQRRNEQYAEAARSSELAMAELAESQARLHELVASRLGQQRHE